MLGLKLIVRQIRHPIFALLCAVLFGCVALVVGGNAVDEAQRFAAADDPVAISERALDRVFTQGAAEREIRTALTAGDVDLAQSFLDLAAERSVQVDPALTDKVKEAQTNAASADTHRRAVCAGTVDWRTRRTLPASLAPRSAIFLCLATSATPRARANAICSGSRLTPDPRSGWCRHCHYCGHLRLARPRRAGANWLDPCQGLRAAPAGSIRFWRCAWRVMR